MVLSIYIENDELDLFQEESVELNSSIADINDISKNTTDYAKSFTVPASANNNSIFRHYYDANIDNAFDARVKISGRIELDGMPFRFGKWSLEKVKIKKGIADSYSINFVGNLVSLKDKLGNDELSSLDLSHLDHNYSPDEVKAMMQFDGDLIYTLLVKKQLYYNSVNDNTNTAKLVNLAFSGGANTGIGWDLMRPSIRLIQLIRAIEIKYDVVFSRDFFDTTQFRHLFLWVNNDGDVSKANNNEVRIDFKSAGSIGLNGGSFDLIEDTFVAGGKRIYGYMFIYPSVGYENEVYSVNRQKDGATTDVVSKLKGTQRTGLSIDRDNPTKHSWSVSSNSEFKFTSKLVITFDYESYQGETSNPEQTINAVFNVAFNMPKIKTIDFLKGLFSMFKLVIIPDDSGYLYVDTIKNYYAKGDLIDITKHVKTDDFEVSRGKLLNEIKFNFAEPTTLLNAQFKRNNGIAYGDEETLLTDDGTPSGKPLEGDALTISLPFEQVIYERLPDSATKLKTNIMYGGIFNDRIEPVNPKPHIFYNINTNIGTQTIGFIDDLGVRTQLIGNINTPSHSNSFLSPQFNIVFGVENNEWTNISSGNTLFHNYYKDYVTSIFNIKRRSFKYEANLPLSILLKLKLNDVLAIKNNYYLIDNFNTDLTSGKASFNLINSFNVKLKEYRANVDELFVSFYAQTGSVTVTNIGITEVTFLDDSWISYSISGSIVFFIFDVNNTGAVRTNTATLTNQATGQIIEIFIVQLNGLVTADNDFITVDSNLITTDDGQDFN